VTSTARTNLDLLRVDFTGSLLRPARLQEVAVRYGRGEAGADELRRVQDECIREVIEKQEAHGMPVVSDGEFRRANFQDSFGQAVSGFDATPSTWDPKPFYDGKTPLRRVESGLSGSGPAIINRRPTTERLRLVRNLPLEEYRFARQVASRPVKVTLVGPDRISQRFEWETSRAVYTGLDEFMADVVAIERQMLTELAEAGCSYVQLDEPGYTAYVDGPSLAKMRERGEDPDANLARSIAATNAVLADLPGATTAVHVCRGNQTGGWHREGSYDAIAERLFGSLNCQRFLLEYDSERAGGFEPLRFVPKGRVVVLGLITTKLPELESVDHLARRIEEASRYLPIEQLALSPQCGFGHFPEDVQWRKLDRMLETAARVWSD
jgi:5-methyltetrahydropteroyltriglutamate--homocysteine methyltransferase